MVQKIQEEKEKKTMTFIEILNTFFIEHFWWLLLSFGGY